MLTYMRPVALLLAFFASLGSELAAQGDQVSVEAASIAVQAVHSDRKPDKILIVPREPLKAGFANMVAQKIGAKSDARACGKKNICDWAPASDVVAVGVDIVSIDDANAVVGVTSRGLRKPGKYSTGQRQHVSSIEVRLKRIGKKWVVIEKNLTATS